MTLSHVWAGTSLLKAFVDAGTPSSIRLPLRSPTSRMHASDFATEYWDRLRTSNLIESVCDTARQDGAHQGCTVIERAYVPDAAGYDHS